jgi:GTP-binding protein EngB required for normal cell division
VTPPSADDLAHCLEEAASIRVVDVAACAQLRDKLTEGAFNLVVAGQFKRGKTSLINALLGRPVLPVAVVPLTSVVTLLRYGSPPAGHVLFESGRTLCVPLGEVAEYVTEQANPRNVKGVRDVTVVYPAEWLRGGIRLVDTPGIGSIYEHNTEVAYRYLPQADAVLFVASADQPMSRAELDFLGDVRQYAGKIFCLLNKVDYLSPTELEEAVAFSSLALREALGQPVPVFPLSAKLALEGRVAEAEEMVQRSGFVTFERALAHFLGEEKAEVWRRSLAANLLRILTQARLSLDLEAAALSAPLERIEASLGSFAAKQAEALQARSDYDALLTFDARRLLKEDVEPALEAFKGNLQHELARRIDDWYAELRDSPLRRLQEELHARAVETVRVAYDDWRAAQDTYVAREFEAICSRFWTRIQGTIDDLLREAAALFSIPYEAVRADMPWRADSGFYYKFWEEPTSLSLLGSSLVLALPKPIGDRVVVRRMRRTAQELAETQAGRVRHDFDERLKKSVQRFRGQMLGRIEATVSGLASAIDKGMAMRQRGQSEMAAQQDELSRLQNQIGGLEVRVRQIAAGSVGASPTSAIRG